MTRLDFRCRCVKLAPPMVVEVARGCAAGKVVGGYMSDLMNRLSLSAAHAKSNDRQPTAQMLLEAIEAIDARDARIAELATALRDVLDLSDTRKRRELAEIKEIIAKARSALAAPDPGAADHPPSEH